MRAVTRVFLVDEDRTTLAVLSAHARRVGYRVESFQRPHDASRALRDRRPDVLVTDRAGPGMPAEELVRAALRADPDTQVVRVAERGAGGGVDALPGDDATCLTKPGAPGDLDRALRLAAGRRRASVRS